MSMAPFLSQVSLFKSLAPAELADLARRMGVRSYRQGEVIFHKGDPGSVLYIIKTGQVKIATLSTEGEEVILAILTEGDFFGELSLFDQEPRSASVIAMVPTETFTLHREDFLSFLYAHPTLAADIIAVLSRRLRHTDILVEDAAFLDLEARLAKRLLELAESHGLSSETGVKIDLRLTQQDLAALVGASRAAVNKQLGAYQAKGLISLGKQSITILRPEELRKRIY
jgi:CRP/FNR family transcriptional regulator/CRP/FNR family cyclic AMP-dependent transcriptional regulator